MVLGGVSTPPRHLRHLRHLRTSATSASGAVASMPPPLPQEAPRAMRSMSCRQSECSIDGCPLFVLSSSESTCTMAARHSSDE